LRKELLAARLALGKELSSQEQQDILSSQLKPGDQAQGTRLTEKLVESLHEEINSLKKALSKTTAQKEVLSQELERERTNLAQREFDLSREKEEMMDSISRLQSEKEALKRRMEAKV